MRLWNWLKNIFSPSRKTAPSLDGFSISWALYDDTEIDHRMELGRKARRMGENCRPPPDALAPDQMELRIEAQIRELFDGDFLRVEKRMGTLKGAAHANTIFDIESSARGRAAIEEQAKQAIESAEKSKDFQLQQLERQQADKLRLVELRGEQEKDVWESRIADYEAHKKNLKQVISDYKETWGIDRNPILTHKIARNKNLRILVVAAFAQMGANAMLFGQGNIRGLSFGFPLAIAFGALDVWGHLFLGVQASQLKAPKPVSRFIGGACSLISLVTILSWNLMLVHARRVSNEFPGVDIEANYMDSLRNHTWDLNEPVQIGLFVFGLLCSIYALRTGYYWDEPIPEFREAQKDIDRNKNLIGEIDTVSKAHKLEDESEKVAIKDVYEKEIEMTRKASAEELERLSRRLHEELNNDRRELRRRARDQVANQEGRIRQIETLVQQLKVQRKSAGKCYKILVKLYRDENASMRDPESCPGPAYFLSPLETLEFPEVDEGLSNLDELKMELEDSLRALRKLIQKWASEDNDGNNGATEDYFERYDPDPPLRPRGKGGSRHVGDFTDEGF